MKVDRQWVHDRFVDSIESRGNTEVLVLQRQVDENGAEITQLLPVDDFLGIFGDTEVGGDTPAADILIARNKNRKMFVTPDGRTASLDKAPVAAPGKPAPEVTEVIIEDMGFGPYIRRWADQGRFAADDT